MVMQFVLAIAVIAAGPPDDKLTYEVFSVAGQAGRQLIVRGVRTYSPACDIVVQESKGESETWWLKSLILDADFGISASVHREPRLTGFGLGVQRPDGGQGFSWDWFDLEHGSVFQKLQGPGRVAATLEKGAGYEELQSIEFLDDITLRYLDDMRKPPGTHTHEVIVRKGSVLRLTRRESVRAPECSTTSERPESQSHATEPAPPPAEEIQLWLTYYYLKPRPELTLSSLDVMELELQKAGRSLAEEATRGGMRSFYARVFAQNDAVVGDVAAKLPSLPAGHQAFVREALRRCGTPACNKVLGTPSAPVDAKDVDPSTLDDSWASFFATGDPRYVREIIEVLPWSEVRGDVNRLLTGGAARWSLASNAYQHARVLAISEERLRTAPEPTKRLLREIIDRAKTERAKNPPPEPKS